MNTDTKQQIETALRAFSGADLRAASIGLLNSLGYQSEKTLDFDNTPDAFLSEFDKRDRQFRKDKALFDRWKSVEFLFQITDDEIQSAGGPASLDFQSGFDARNYQSYLFFALDLEKNHYTRTQLSDITREINLLFDMPAMLLLRHDCALTFSIIDRRLHKKDQSRDVLEKVKLIKDIRYQEAHRAHIEILYDLALPTLMAKHKCRDFTQLHEAWRATLDTNELNKKFYRELADWYFWALAHVAFPDDVEKDAATRNATNVIRLLTRLIFCWFLKEKGLIPAELFSERKLAGILKSLRDDDSTFYRAILQNLFFGTLNQRMNTGGQENRKFTSDGSFHERKDEYGVKNMYRYQKLFTIAEEEAIKLFSDIPFLNGGLFDCLDKEDDSGKVVYVDGFTRNTRKQPNVPNFLFFSDYRTLDLSDAYGDKKKKKENVRGLIRLLVSYKFTITENTPIEEEIALDPELLGKVFENLLASYNPETGTTARKQTGSFYTPREIVNYMVDESLIAYLEGQLKAKVPKLSEMKDLQDLLREVFAYTEKVHPFDEEEVNALIDAIDKCKILDPACGSGAFPMGILHKLVFILGKLDPHNERWKHKQLDKLDSVSMREELERIFEDNDDDYGRKLYLIENCIYGVDIQPIAIQISKLRFFISLICDQRTNKNKAQNCGVRPLPNLETKFVAANTLISLDRGKGRLVDQRLPKLEKELAAVRHKHFAAMRRRDKLALQKRDAKLREEIAGVLADGGMSEEASHQLAAWDPYDQNTFAPFFDPEWMYGVTEGFHVVIGNPPYVSALEYSRIRGESARADLKLSYETACGAYDLYVVFIECGFRLLAKSGHLTFITPNKYLSAKYAVALRQYILKNASFRCITNVSRLSVFEQAAVYPVISMFDRQQSIEPVEVLLPFPNASVFEPEACARHQVDARLLSVLPENIWGFMLSSYASFLPKLLRNTKPLGSLGQVNATSTASEADEYGAHIANVASEDAPRLVNTGTIEPFISLWGKKQLKHQGHTFITPYLPLRAAGVSSRRQKMYQTPKIIFAKMAKTCEALLDFRGEYASLNTNCFFAPQKGISLKYIAGVCNSRVFTFVYSLLFDALRMSGGYFQFQAPQLRVMPVLVADCPVQQRVAQLVDQILDAKAKEPNEDTQPQQTEIDKLLYDLYELTPDEIAIVEGRNT